MNVFAEILPGTTVCRAWHDCLTYSLHGSLHLIWCLSHHSGGELPELQRRMRRRETETRGWLSDVVYMMWKKGRSGQPAVCECVISFEQLSSGWSKVCLCVLLVICLLSQCARCYMSLDSAWPGAQPVEVSRVNLHVMEWRLPQINV